MAAADGKVDRDRCRYYKKRGIERECRKKQRDEAAAAAHLTREEDGGESGHALHMATVVELVDATPPQRSLSITQSTPTLLMREQVHLNEERARVVLRR